jgi:hypothetical protein
LIGSGVRRNYGNSNIDDVGGRKRNTTTIINATTTTTQLAKRTLPGGNKE